MNEISQINDYESLVIEGIEARQMGDEGSWRLGELAARVEITHPRHSQELRDYARRVGVAYNTLKDYRWVFGQYGVDERSSTLSWGHHQAVAGREDRLEWLRRAEEQRWSVDELRQSLRMRGRDVLLVDPPVGQYRAVVIDPPWPLEKIGREVDFRQGLVLDYPTRTVEELKLWPAQNLMAQDGCHVYLWTTQRFLCSGEAFDVMRAWGVTPSLVLVWNKAGGYTPFTGWQYNAEFVVWGRLGGLPLLVNGKKVVFEGPRREHSRKPDEFYDLVREISSPPRIDVFSREPREGFDQWGNEVDRFANDL